MYEQFGAIGLYDLKTGKTKPVSIRVEGDFPELRTKLVDVGTPPAGLARGVAQRRARGVHRPRRSDYGSGRKGRPP